MPHKDEEAISCKANLIYFVIQIYLTSDTNEPGVRAWSRCTK